MLILSGLASIAGFVLLLWAALAKGQPSGNHYGPVEAAPLTLRHLLDDGHA